MTPGASGEACAVCGSTDLSVHLRVADADGDLEGEPTTARYGRALADIVHCGECGHMQLATMAEPSALLDAYGATAADESLEEEAGQRETARRTLETLEAVLPQRGLLLDVGCWTGEFLVEARSRGWEVAGVEPSEFASRHAREVHGLDVRCADLLGADLPRGAFDAIVLRDVLEHLPDPAHVLDRIGTLLVPGGIVQLALPDSGSRVARLLGSRWWSVLPTHVQYFTRGSLVRLLRDRGFEPLRLGTAPKTFTVRYYLGRLAGYAPPLARMLVGLATLAGVADRLWTPDFRDRMEVIARSRLSL